MTTTTGVLLDHVAAVRRRMDAARRAMTEAAEATRRADPAAEAHRQRVLAMLAERPGIRSEDGASYAAELIVPRERYDGIDLLELIQRHTRGSA